MDATVSVGVPPEIISPELISVTNNEPLFKLKLKLELSPKAYISHPVWLKVWAVCILELNTYFLPEFCDGVELWDTEGVLEEPELLELLGLV